MDSKPGSSLDKELVSRSVALPSGQQFGSSVNTAAPSSAALPAEMPRSRPLPIPLAKPIVTQVLVGINVLVWLAVSIYALAHYHGDIGGVLMGDSESLNLALIDAGSLINACVANPTFASTDLQLQLHCIGGNQWWRLFTSMFLHYGILHLGLNAVSLYIFGREVEQIYGRRRFLVIYLLAGLAGGIMSLTMLPELKQLSAGASGAIYGVLGILLAYYFRYRNELGTPGRTQLYNIILVVTLNFFLSSQLPRINNWAHFGGFLGGAVLGLLLAPNYQVVDVSPHARHLMDKINPTLQAGVLVAYLVTLGLCFALGLSRLGGGG